MKASSLILGAIAAIAIGNAQNAGRYVVLSPTLQTGQAAPAATPLTTWNGSFTYQGKTFGFNMVGTDPAKTNTATTIQAFIIPIKIVITSGATKTSFDPAHVLANGKTVIANTVASPIFDSTTTYTQGGVNVGATQYIDAYQRANFWGSVQTNSNYHLLLGGPTVLRELTLSPPASKGVLGTPFGHKVAEVDINWIDGQFHNIMTALKQITPNAIPIFLTYDTYLTQGGCCIGGYHSAFGAASAPQAYSQFSYIDYVGDFAQDVSALSHEIGEWADDPLVVNTNGNPVPAACGGGAILENGDPLEGFPNYGGFPYTVNGFQYNLQDLVTLPYFGAPPATSVDGFFSFQGQHLTVCEFGG